MVYVSGGNELLNAQEIIAKLGLKAGDKIADLGCGGVGHFIIPAAQIVGQGGIAYAVDILKSALMSVVSRARLMGVNNIKTVWSNLEIVGAAKIPEQSLDYAFIKNVLFQSKFHENIFKEADRLLKPGGKILVIDWKQEKTPFGPPAVDRVKPEKVKEICAKLNLKLIEEFSAGIYHYGLIFQKT